MQIIVSAQCLKVHCDANIIVSMLHANYCKEHVEAISLNLIRVCKCRRGYTFGDWKIIGGERGWFYIRHNSYDVLTQIMQLSTALCKFKGILPYPQFTIF